MPEELNYKFDKIGFPATQQLLLQGISAGGVQQLLAGKAVAGLADRTTIKRIIQTSLRSGRTETVDNNETITVHGNRTETVSKDFLHRAGISSQGAQQILFGQPVTNSNDCQRLGAIVCGLVSGHRRATRSQVVS